MADRVMASTMSTIHNEDRSARRTFLGPDPCPIPRRSSMRPWPSRRSSKARPWNFSRPAERRQQAELDRMLKNPADKATLVELTDQAFRSHAAARTAEQFTHILDVQGIPRFFGPLDRTLLLGFQTFGDWLPSVTVPLVKAHLRHETANVVLPAEPELLHEHLAARRAPGAADEPQLPRRGAARRGGGEAAAGEVSRCPPVARRGGAVGEDLHARLADLADRPRAHARPALRPTGTALPRRRPTRPSERPTASRRREVRIPRHGGVSRSLAHGRGFMRTLSRPGLAHGAAGIALQAYVPDSFRWQRRITEWARERVAAGGSPVTIRIVKGANMEMERIDAALHDWPQAPFHTKPETDANYKRMLDYALHPENLAAVHMGIASHNLFDVAYGLVLSADRGARRPRAVRDARRHGQPPAAGPARPYARGCCSTRPPAARRSFSTRSAT